MHPPADDCARARLHQVSAPPFFQSKLFPPFSHLSVVIVSTRVDVDVVVATLQPSVMAPSHTVGSGEYDQLVWEENRKARRLLRAAAQ